jgi:hypothetical protein
VRDVTRPSLAYAPRRAADSVLYQVVRDHYETFAAEAASWREGDGLPRFIDEAAFARSASASRAVASAEAGVSRVPEMRLARGRVRPLPLRRVWPGSPRALLVQEPHGLSVLWWAPHAASARPVRGSAQRGGGSASASLAVAVAEAGPSALHTSWSTSSLTCPCASGC